MAAETFCETAVENYLTELCTPTTGDKGYPWGCIRLSKDEVKTQLEEFAQRSCSLGGDNSEYLTNDMGAKITEYVDNMEYALMDILAEECENMGGYWIYEDDSTYGDYGADATPYTQFYSETFGVRVSEFKGAEDTGADYGLSYGQCAENTIQVRCNAYNELYGDDVATYDATRNVCNLSDEWYRQQCESMLGGYYENGTCYARDPNED